jgi:hypothetical protein
VYVVFCVLLYIFISAFSTTRFSENDRTTWPATFTFDWQGGHGRDRYDIMSGTGPFYSGPCQNRNDGPIYRDC